MAARSDIQAGRAFVSLYVKNSAFQKGLQAASAKLRSFGSSVAVAGGIISGIGAAIVGPLTAAVTQFASMGDTLDKMRNRTGASVKFLAEMGFAAEQAGQDLKLVEKGLIGSQKAVSDLRRGLDTAADGFAVLGLTAKDFDGLNAEQQFELILSRLDATGDEIKRNEAAMLIYGKKAGPAIASIAAGIAEVRAEAERRGLVPSEESVKDAALITDAINRVRRTVGSAIYEIGAAIAPALLPALEIIANIVTATIHWIKQNGPLFRMIAAIGGAILGAGAAITAIGGMLFLLGTALGGIASAITFVGSILGFVLSPLGLIAVALTAGIFAWLKWTQSGQSAMRNLIAFFGPLLQTAKDTFKGIFDALMAGDLELAGKIALTGLQLVFAQSLSAIANMIGGTLGDAIGAIGGQILGGDFKGAWDTAVAGMAALWDVFASGVVNVFTEAAKKVTEVWRQTVSSISDFILEQSAKGGVFGAAMSKVLGVDMQAEQERADRLNQQLGLAPQNITDEAKQTAREQISGTADAITGFLDDMNQVAADQAAASSAAFQERVAGGAAGAGGDVARLMKELEDLRKQAATAREAAKFTTPDPAELPGGESAKAASAFVTFSGLALAGQGTVGGVQERMAKSLDTLLLESKKLVAQGQRNLDATMKLLTAE